MSCSRPPTHSPGVRSPSTRSRLKVSRPERPASTRIRVVLVATSAQFPRLPLASTDTDTPIAVAYPYRLWKREQFFTSPYLWWDSLGAAPINADLDRLLPVSFVSSTCSLQVLKKGRGWVVACGIETDSSSASFRRLSAAGMFVVAAAFRYENFDTSSPANRFRKGLQKSVHNASNAEIGRYIDEFSSCPDDVSG